MGFCVCMCVCAFRICIIIYVDGSIGRHSFPKKHAKIRRYNQQFYLYHQCHDIYFVRTSSKRKTITINIATSFRLHNHEQSFVAIFNTRKKKQTEQRQAFTTQYTQYAVVSILNTKKTIVVLCMMIVFLLLFVFVYLYMFSLAKSVSFILWHSPIVLSQRAQIQIF